MKTYNVSLWYKGQRLHITITADTQSQARSMVIGMFAGCTEVSVNG